MTSAVNFPAERSAIVRLNSVEFCARTYLPLILGKSLLNAARMPAIPGSLSWL